MDISNPGKTHIPCVLLVDTSAAMEGDLILDLNRSINYFIDLLRRDEKLWDCTDLCVIRFDSRVKMEKPFTSVNLIIPPVMSASDLYDCVMNEAIITGLDVINQRKQEYQEAGVDFWRPWLFLVTGFLPTDAEYGDAAVRRLQEAVQGNKVNYLQVHCGNTNLTGKLYCYGKNGVVAKGKIVDAFCQLKTAMSDSVKDSPYGSLSEVELEDTPFNIQINI